MGFLKVLNSRVLGPPSRLALIIGAWLALHVSFKSFEFAGVGSTVELGASIIGAWRILHGISKSSEFAGVGPGVEVGFDYRGLACIIRDC